MRAVRALATIAILGTGTLIPTSASAQVDPVTLVLSPSEGKVGDRIIVRLEGWASSAVTLTVCGNLGLRGAPDCDVTAGQAVGLARAGATLTELTISAPPTTCPCVIRAASATNSEVRTTPITIPGIAVGPVVKAETPDLVAVSATVTEVREGFGGTIRPLLGGRTRHRVAITLRNTTSVALAKISLGVAVGRTADGAQPLAVPVVEPLQPGETRVYAVPATLAAPTRGGYLWDVTVDGAGPRVGVQTTSSATPWLLYVLVVLLVVDVVALATVKRRRRRQRRRAGGRADELRGDDAWQPLDESHVLDDPVVAP